MAVGSVFARTRRSCGFCCISTANVVRAPLFYSVCYTRCQHTPATAHDVLRVRSAGNRGTRESPRARSRAAMPSRSSKHEGEQLPESALCVKKRWLDLILSGQKTVELRHFLCRRHHQFMTPACVGYVRPPRGRLTSD